MGDVGFFFYYFSNDKGAMGSDGETPKDVKRHKKNLKDLMNFFGGCQGMLGKMQGDDGSIKEV
jgi:hypothetical protein